MIQILPVYSLMVSLSLYWQDFTQTQVDPLHRRVDEINKAGQSLMRSAGPGVSTDNVEADLDTVNNKWSKLAEQVWEIAWSIGIQTLPL